MSLSERLRPGVECAPWVYEEVCCLEAERAQLRAELAAKSKRVTDLGLAVVSLRAELATTEGQRNRLYSAIEQHRLSLWQQRQVRHPEDLALYAALAGEGEKQ